MGRKKRKVQNDPPAVVVETAAETKQDDTSQSRDVLAVEPDDKKPATSSGYAMTSHSGDIYEAEIYVSDGSEEEEDDGSSEVDIVLSASRMGMMRRGGHPSILQQQNRQWVRSEKKDSSQDEDQVQPTSEEFEERRRQQEEEEMAKLDPAQRAARLLAEKQRKLEEAKESARRLESEENAGRDPCLFSKRTAFDIRMDQIEDKPWVRGGDMRDFFNYNMTEEDWSEYSHTQLQIRQELTDASRQRRLPDPAIVPVAPRAPQKQNPKVAVVSSTSGNAEEGDNAAEGEQPSGESAMIGPALVQQGPTSASSSRAGEAKDSITSGAASASDVKHVGTGGAWGAGVAPDSVLAKLIEEQGKPQTTTATPKEPQRQASDQEWTNDRESFETDHREDRYRHNSRYEDDRHYTRNQDVSYGYRNDWHGGNEYDRGRYDANSQYASSQFRPRRGGYSGGRGGYQQRPPPQGMGRGGRGNHYDYYSRKRPREDY